MLTCPYECQPVLKHKYAYLSLCLIGLQARQACVVILLMERLTMRTAPAALATMSSALDALHWLTQQPRVGTVKVHLSGTQLDEACAALMALVDESLGAAEVDDDPDDAALLRLKAAYGLRGVCTLLANSGGKAQVGGWMRMFHHRHRLLRCMHSDHYDDCIS